MAGITSKKTFSATGAGNFGEGQGNTPDGVLTLTVGLESKTAPNQADGAASTRGHFIRSNLDKEFAGSAAARAFTGRTVPFVGGCTISGDSKVPAAEYA